MVNFLAISWSLKQNALIKVSLVTSMNENLLLSSILFLTIVEKNVEQTQIFT